MFPFSVFPPFCFFLLSLFPLFSIVYSPVSASDALVVAHIIIFLKIFLIFSPFLGQVATYNHVFVQFLSPSGWALPLVYSFSTSTLPVTCPTFHGFAPLHFLTSVTTSLTITFAYFPLWRRCFSKRFHQSPLLHICVYLFNFPGVGAFLPSSCTHTVLLLGFCPPRACGWFFVFWPWCMFLTKFGWCRTSFCVYGHSVFNWLKDASPRTCQAAASKKKRLSAKLHETNFFFTGSWLGMFQADHPSVSQTKVIDAMTIITYWCSTSKKKKHKHANQAKKPLSEIVMIAKKGGRHWWKPEVLGSQVDGCIWFRIGTTHVKINNTKPTNSTN